MKGWSGKRFAVAWLALAMAVGAEAQSHHWSSLGRVKPGSGLIVETSNRYGPLGFDRCRMVSADAASLTCVEVGSQGARLVFPESQVEYVSRVTKRVPVLAILAAALGAVLLGGILSGNGDAIVVGLLFGAIAGGAAAEQRGWDALTGRPPAPTENIHLIYRRLHLPPAVDAAPDAVPLAPFLSQVLQITVEQPDGVSTKEKGPGGMAPGQSNASRQSERNCVECPAVGGSPPERR